MYAEECIQNNYSNIEVIYDTVRGCSARISNNTVKTVGGEFIIQPSDIWGREFDWDESEDETISKLNDFLAKRLQGFIDEENAG